MKLSFAPLQLVALFAMAIEAQGADAPEWEEAPFMNEFPNGEMSNHCIGFTLKGKSYLQTGNLQVINNEKGCNLTFAAMECGDEEFSDLYTQYDPVNGYTDLGPHPAGYARGYAIGDVMYPGTDEEIYFFGFGQAKLEKIFPRWNWENETTKENYVLVENYTSFPRLDDMWTFDGTDWNEVTAPFPGIGRTHPVLIATEGKVYVGVGFGEVCTNPWPETPLEDMCTATDQVALNRLGDKQDALFGKSSNLHDFYEYNVATNEWKRIADYPFPNHHPYFFDIGGKPYVFGGHNGGFLYNSTYRYEAADDEWVRVADAPIAPAVAGSQFTYKDYGCVIAGEGDGEGFSENLYGFQNSLEQRDTKQHHRAFPKSSFICYVADKDQWVTLPDAPGLSRWVPTTFILEDQLYYVQGPIRQGQYSTYEGSWPVQGYRINMTEIDVYIQKVLSGDTGDNSTDDNTGDGDGDGDNGSGAATTATAGAFFTVALAVALPLLTFGW